MRYDIYIYIYVIRRLKLNFVMSLRPTDRLSVLISAVSIGRIFVKFDIEEFHENTSRNCKFC